MGRRKVVTGQKCPITFHSAKTSSQARFRLTIDCDCAAQLYSCTKHLNRVLLGFEHHCNKYPIGVLVDVLPRIWV